METLPDNIKKLPKHAQEIWLATFNNAFKQYNDESKAFAVANAAVKKAGYSFKEEITEVIKSYDLDEGCVAFEYNGEKYVSGTVSGLKEDRDGERMSEKACNSIIKALNSGRIPFYSNHGRDEYGNKVYRWQDCMGKWVAGFWDDTHTHVKGIVRLNKHHPDSEKYYNYIKSKMPIGFSIGGKRK